MKQYDSVLVCVTQQRTCERLIQSASALKKDEGSLYVLHVARENWNFFENIREGEALEYLFVVSKTVGADLTVIHSPQVEETIAQFAYHMGVQLIVLGAPPQHAQSPFLDRLQQLLSDSGIEIHALTTSDEPSLFA